MLWAGERVRVYGVGKANAQSRFLNTQAEHSQDTLHFSYEDQIKLGIYAFQYVCMFLIFVLGFKAPGLPTMEQRHQFAYRTLQDPERAQVCESWTSLSKHAHIAISGSKCKSRINVQGHVQEAETPITVRMAQRKYQSADASIGVYRPADRGTSSQRLRAGVS